MTKSKNLVRLPLAAALAVALTCLFLPLAAHAQNISQTAKAGKYSITLKVLPAESFMGTDAAMAYDGGAKPEAVDGPMQPNHHMVAFISRDGHPVERANVKIRYRLVSNGGWKNLPVARMHVKGKGADTTHFGNNVKLMPGQYQVQVTVNHKRAKFHFTLQ
jgi:hypothetical protein